MSDNGSSCNEDQLDLPPFSPFRGHYKWNTCSVVHVPTDLKDKADDPDYQLRFSSPGIPDDTEYDKRKNMKEEVHRTKYDDVLKITKNLELLKPHLKFHNLGKRDDTKSNVIKESYPNIDSTVKNYIPNESRYKQLKMNKFHGSDWGDRNERIPSLNKGKIHKMYNQRSLLRDKPIWNDQIGKKWKRDEEFKDTQNMRTKHYNAMKPTERLKIDLIYKGPNSLSKSDDFQRLRTPKKEESEVIANTGKYILETDGTFSEYAREIYGVTICSISTAFNYQYSTYNCLYNEASYYDINKNWLCHVGNVGMYPHFK